jgi:hypothetical protein
MITLLNSERLQVASENGDVVARSEIFLNRLTLLGKMNQSHGFLESVSLVDRDDKERERNQ